MKTSRLTFNLKERAVILPALEMMLNRIAGARRGSFAGCDDLHIVNPGKEIYRKRRFDDGMAAHVLSCRNKLKNMNATGKVRLNSFELAAATLALRVVVRMRLVAEHVLSADRIPDLGAKLELYRKRARNASIKQEGAPTYAEKAERWRGFVQWLRFDILSSRPQRRIPSGVLMVHREQRETMRRLAMDVVVETADRSRIYHLADLARREIRRQRHGTTLRSLLKDHNHARQFLAKFIIKREGMDLLRPEYQPESLRASMCDQKFKAALSQEGSASPSRVMSAVTPAALTNVHKRLHESPMPEIAEKAYMESHPERAPVPAPNLSRHLARWFMEEVEPGYRQDVASEIKTQVWSWADCHRKTVAATKVADVIAECRPDIDGCRGYDLINFYSEWGTRWLLALNPDIGVVCPIVGTGLRLANEQWERLSLLTRQRKISQIYRRYF